MVRRITIQNAPWLYPSRTIRCRIRPPTRHPQSPRRRALQQDRSRHLLGPHRRDREWRSRHQAAAPATLKHFGHHFIIEGSSAEKKQEKEGTIEPRGLCVHLRVISLGPKRSRNGLDIRRCNLNPISRAELFFELTLASHNKAVYIFCTRRPYLTRINLIVHCPATNIVCYIIFLFAKLQRNCINEKASFLYMKETFALSNSILFISTSVRVILEVRFLGKRRWGWGWLQEIIKGRKCPCVVRVYNNWQMVKKIARLFFLSDRLAQGQ